MADEKVDKSEEALNPSDAPKGGGSTGTLVMIIVAFVVMIVTPLVCFFLVKIAVPEEINTESVVTEKNVEAIIELKPLLVNIAQTKGTRILRIVPYLVVSEERLKTYLEERMPMLTDMVGMVASRKSIDDLEGQKGRESIKRDLISEINSAVKGEVSGAVIDVYFTEFLIQ